MPLSGPLLPYRHPGGKNKEKIRVGIWRSGCFHILSWRCVTAVKSVIVVFYFNSDLPYRHIEVREGECYVVNERRVGGMRELPAVAVRTSPSWLGFAERESG